MAISQSSTEQTSVIRIDIDGDKYCLQLSHSSNAAEIRSILSKRYNISSNTYFLDSEGCRFHTEDEQSVTISELLTENNFVQLKTDQSKPTSIKIPQRKNKIILPTDLDRNMWKNTFRNCNLFYGIRMDEETPKRAFKPLLQFKETINDFDFHLTDDSYIRAHMKDKEMHSSLLSSQFFDGGINVSCPFIGIGINAEYLKSKGTTNIKKKTYLTYCFNFPRVTLQLDLSYLEPTTQFIKAIDTVLMTLTRDEQIIKLEEVLSTYGHVFPRSVVLGGHLYHKEVHDNQEKAEEANKRINVDMSFSLTTIQPAKIHAGSGSKKKSEKRVSEQTSLLTFEAVGGDTRYNCDPTLWTNTIADPSLWRIIEQDNYQSVITLLDQERQQKLEKIFSYYTQKNIISNMNNKWKQVGLTIVGRSCRANKINLDFPQSVFIDDDQTIYIADRENHRIVEWKTNANNGRIVAGGNDKGNNTNQLNYPRDVIIDKENNCFIISDNGNRRIMRWSRQNNTNGQIIISDIDCSRLIMDKDGSLYVSDWKKNEVRRWNKGDIYGTVVAGGNGKGEKLHQLDCPTHIFVDEEYSVYVSDRDNHRVVKWVKDAKEGIVVAGRNGPGNSLTQLSSPKGIIVDQAGQIYVADYDNHRVMRWCNGAKEGTIVVGGNGKGQQSNQFNGPKGLSFDRAGNLYVTDCKNHRIQKFEIDFD